MSDAAVSRPDDVTLLLRPEPRWVERHPRLVDWAWAGFYGGLSALWIAFLSPSSPPQIAYFFDLGPMGPKGVEMAAVAANIVALLLWRRRRPWLLVVVVALTQALVLLAADSQTMYTDIVIVWVALFTVAFRVGYVSALWLTGLLLVVQVRVAVVAGGWWGVRLAVLVLPEILVALGTVLAGRRARIKQDRMAEAELRRREYERWARQAVTFERARIAREMNDIVSHALAETVALADGAALVLDKQPERARAALDQIQARGRQSVADMRRMVGVLRSDDPEPEPPPAAGRPARPDRSWPPLWTASHGVVVDLLIGAGHVAVGLFSLEQYRDGATATGRLLFTPAAVSAVLLAAMVLELGALFLWRRRAPVVFLGAVLALNLVGNAVSGALPTDFLVFVGVYQIVVDRGTRSAGLVAAPYVLWAFVDRLVGLAQQQGVDPWPDALLTLSLNLVAMWGAVTLGSLTRRRAERLVGGLDEAQAFREAQETRARTDIAAEHARIAREMHDVVSHSLTVMVALADGALASLDKNPARARQALDRLASAGRQSVADMRQMLGLLGDDEEAAGEAAELRPQPGGPELERLVEDFRQAGLPVSLTLRGDVPQDPALVLTAYRVVQEALTNVLRHAADPTRVDVTVTAGGSGPAPEALTIDVVNDGGMGSVQRLLPSGGHGLVGLRERASMFGGTADMGPRPGGGWQVHVVLPTSGKRTTG